MLVQFRVRNFLSFGDTQIFSMRAGKFRNFTDRVYTGGKYKLLKFMSIYGANASGKSNLISAIGFFKNIIVNGLDHGTYPYYCRTEETNKDCATLFEIKIDINNRIFVYGFEVFLNTGSFSHEWLYEELKNGSKHDVFDRNIKNGKIIFGTYIKSTSSRERLKIYGDDVKSDDSILFLKLMNQNKDSLYKYTNKMIVFKQIYNWIKFKLSVNSPERPITNYSWLIDHNNLNEIEKKLNHFATGIEKVYINSIAPEKVSSNFPKEMIKDVHEMLSEQKSTSDSQPAVLIRSPDNSMFIISIDDHGGFEYKTFEFKHKNSQSIYSLEEESDGTVRLLDIIEILLNNDNDKVYVVDEINRMFHPLLTVKFVQEFLEMAKERNIQLVVTTHESQLMNLKLLRKDEINFINKDERGNSSIGSLADSDDRYDKKIIKEYFNGKYDAIPFRVKL